MFQLEINEAERFLLIALLGHNKEATWPNGDKSVSARDLMQRVVELRSGNPVAQRPAAMDGRQAATAILAPPAPAKLQPPPGTEFLQFTPSKAEMSGKRLIVKGYSNGFVSCWEEKLISTVSARVGEPTTFVVKRSEKDGKTFLNIVGIA